MITSSRPAAGHVHIYCLALPLHPSELSHFGRLLSAGETGRAESLKIDQVRNRYIAGRGVLREILGGYLGVEPENVPIVAGEHGKPVLADSAATLCFNLSHAGDVFLLAVSGGLEVGIDIETVETGKPLNDMARIVFSRREQEEISRLPSPQRQTEAFYRCWVRKEACLKACGAGFSLSSDSFDVSPLDEAARIKTVVCNQINWQVLDIDVPHGYCAALAVEPLGSALLPPTLVRVAHRLSNA